jgi:16S rRNA (guanine527-N7)-methyltransferase
MTTPDSDPIESRAESPPPRKDWRTALTAGATALGIDLAPAQVAAFDAYLSLLLEWNQRINLTSVTDPAEVSVIHFVDSLTCLASVQLEANIRLLDIGSGAGFPGIPIAICRPDLSVTLLESTQKKCRFLDAVIDQLSLAKVTVDCRRAEAAGHDPNLRESFDIVVTRAVADLAAVAELSLPLLRVGGAALAMKGPRAGEEIPRATDAVRILGGVIQATREFSLGPRTAPVRRVIVIMRKVAPTPVKYPRAPGVPAKRPLGIDRRRRAE